MEIKEQPKKVLVPDEELRKRIKAILTEENKMYNQSKYIKPKYGYNHSHPIYK